MNGEQSISLFPPGETTGASTPFSPELLAELAGENEVWIPIEIKRGFLKMKLEELIQRELESETSFQSADGALAGESQADSLNRDSRYEDSLDEESLEDLEREDAELNFEALKPVQEEFERELEKSISGNLDFLNYPIGFLRLSRSEGSEKSFGFAKGSASSVGNLKKTGFLSDFLSSSGAESGDVGSCASFQDARRIAVALGDLISEFQFMRFRVWFLELDGAANVAPKPAAGILEGAVADAEEGDADGEREVDARFSDAEYRESDGGFSGECAEAESDFDSEMDDMERPDANWASSEKSLFRGKKRAFGKALLDQFVSSRSPERNRFVGDFRKLLTYSCLALGMDAVGIYLPNFKNQTFKLRAHYGLAMDRLMGEIRSFCRAQTDLRVYQQNTVVTIDESWPEGMSEIPEDFPSAVCIPLRSRTFSYGTVWFFSNKAFIPEATTRLIELFGELFALNIENEHFQRRDSGASEYRRELKAASRFQALASPIHLTGSFEIAGWTKAGRTLCCLRTGDASSGRRLRPRNSVSGDFYEWMTLPDGQTLVALGSVGASGLVGAMLVAAVRSALRSHASYGHSVSELLTRVNQTLWHQLSADARISLFCAVIRQESPYLGIHFAQAGDLRGLKIGCSGTFQSIPLSRREASRGLGNTSDFHCFEDCIYLKQNESFVVFNDGLSMGKREMSENGFASCASGNLSGAGRDWKRIRRKVERELGRLISQKKNSSVCLKVSQIRNFFMDRPWLGGKDQSAIALQFVESRQSGTVCCGEIRKSRAEAGRRSS